MKSLSVISMSVVAIMALAACNGSRSNSVSNADSTNSAKIDSGNLRLSSSASRFMVKAFNGGMTEIQLSKKAKKNSNSQRIKSFADMIINDHKKANSKLKSFAQTKNVTLPDSLSSESKSTVENMDHKKGKEFDKDYMKTMVKDHKSTISDFKREMKEAKNPQLKSWISNTLPVLEKHLDSAKVIDSVLKK